MVILYIIDTILSSQNLLYWTAMFKAYNLSVYDFFFNLMF